MNDIDPEILKDDDPFAYCAGLVDREDDDLALCRPYLRHATAPRTLAIYALAVQVRQIPAQVSEPPLGEIRLQWWRDGLDEILAGKTPRGHPVLKALAISGAVDDRLRALAEQGIEARARLLYREPFSDGDELLGFLAAAEGWLAAALLPDASAPAAMDLGAACALARWRPVLQSLWLSAGARFPAAGRAAEHFSVSDAAPAAYLALRRGYNRRRAATSWPLGKRLAILRAVATGRV